MIIVLCISVLFFVGVVIDFFENNTDLFKGSSYD